MDFFLNRKKEKKGWRRAIIVELENIFAQQSEACKANKISSPGPGEKGGKNSNNNNNNIFERKELFSIKEYC